MHQSDYSVIIESGLGLLVVMDAYLIDLSGLLQKVVNISRE